MNWFPENEEIDPGDFIVCPGCGTQLVWSDALILGCSGCDWEFYEEEVDETFFEPEGPEQ